MQYIIVSSLYFDNKIFLRIMDYYNFVNTEVFISFYIRLNFLYSCLRGVDFIYSYFKKIIYFYIRISLNSFLDYVTTFILVKFVDSLM
jgi:hypothetical protein